MESESDSALALCFHVWTLFLSPSLVDKSKQLVFPPACSKLSHKGDPKEYTLQAINMLLTKDIESIFHGDCMRCGKYGHRARDCPQKKPKKRDFSA